MRQPIEFTETERTKVRKENLRFSPDLTFYSLSTNEAHLSGLFCKPYFSCFFGLLWFGKFPFIIKSS